MANRDLLEKALKIIQEGDARGVSLRLLGGLAVCVVSPSAINQASLQREYADIDFVGLGRDNWKIKHLFRDLGYIPDDRFNALHGNTRLLFFTSNGERHIDIFLDRFRMCHNLDLRQRLFNGYSTLSLADLLITKLQVVQMNEKDMMDILAILLDHKVQPEENQQLIDLAYLARLVSGDWGLYTTVSDNLQRASAELQNYLNEQQCKIVVRRIEAILDTLDAVPKTTTWRLRAKIGRRMEWYELPDEVNR
jgi:hypothetical protein